MSFEYALQLAQEIDRQFAEWETTSPGAGGPLHRKITALSEELAKVEASDLAPGHRNDFAELRAQIANIRHAKSSPPFLEKYKEHVRNLIPILESVPSAGAGNIREFAFITDPNIRKLLQRDYNELERVLVAGRVIKPIVIACGSILEGVLTDLLTKDAAAVALAMRSPKAPKKKGGATKDILLDDWENQWSLSDLIKVACDLNIVRDQDEKTMQAAVREFRNFVHPRVELKRGALTPGYAMAAKGNLDIILDHLQ